MFSDIKNQLLKNHTVQDYLHGGCYMFAKAVVDKYGGLIYINRQQEHCAVMYEGRLYDILGRIKNTEGFRLIKPWETKMCEEQYKL